MIDLRKLTGIVEEVIGDLPHPLASSITVKDYKAHEKAAGMMKNPDQALPKDVVAAYHLLTQMKMSPHEFENTWQLARPVANRFLGRDPRPQEIGQFTGAHPADVQDYYSSHPYPGHEEVKAGDFVRYYHASKPIAQGITGRNPLPVEIARFASAGYSDEDIQNHYTHEGKGKGG